MIPECQYISHLTYNKCIFQSKSILCRMLGKLEENWESTKICIFSPIRLLEWELNANKRQVPRKIYLKNTRKVQICSLILCQKPIWHGVFRSIFKLKIWNFHTANFNMHSNKILKNNLTFTQKITWTNRIIRIQSARTNHKNIYLAFEYPSRMFSCEANRHPKPPKGKKISSEIVK